MPLRLDSDFKNTKSSVLTLKLIFFFVPYGQLVRKAAL